MNYMKMVEFVGLTGPIKFDTSGLRTQFELVLYCTVLYCTVLYRTVLYCSELYCTVLHNCTTALLHYCTSALPHFCCHFVTRQLNVAP